MYPAEFSSVSGCGSIASHSAPQEEEIFIWVEYAKIENTALDLQQARKAYRVAALCANYTSETNEVTPSALRLCFQSGSTAASLSRWAEEERIGVTIGWRPKPDGVLVETFHALRCGQASSGSHGIIFEGNIDHVLRATNHIEDFTRTMDAKLAAMATSPFRSSSRLSSSSVDERYSSLTPRSRSSSRARSLSPRVRDPTSDSGAITRATRPTRHHDRRRIHASRLLETYKHYASGVYQATGDTTEVLRALELSRIVTASQLQNM